MTKQAKALLDKLRTLRSPFTWEDIMALPNGARTDRGRKARNVGAFHELMGDKLICRAGEADRAIWCEAYNRETERMVRDLRAATDAGDWTKVIQIADEIRMRPEGIHYGPEYLYVVPLPDREFAKAFTPNKHGEYA